MKRIGKTESFILHRYHGDITGDTCNPGELVLGGIAGACGSATCASTASFRPRKSDRVYALTGGRRAGTRRDATSEGYPSVRNYGSHTGRSGGDGDKKITRPSTPGESADRTVDRRRIDVASRAASKLPSYAGSSGRSALSRCTERHSWIKTGSYPGVEWQRHDPLVRSNLRPSRPPRSSRPPIAGGHFRGL